MAFEDFDHNRGSVQVATIWELHPAIVTIPKVSIEPSGWACVSRGMRKLSSGCQVNDRLSNRLVSNVIIVTGIMLAHNP